MSIKSDHSLDPIKVQRWIDAFPNQNEIDIATDIINNITHISWSKFKESLIEISKKNK